MTRKFAVLYTLLLTFALPVAAFAEGESFNPPNAVGWTMFLLALGLPIATSIWLRTRK